MADDPDVPNFKGPYDINPQPSAADKATPPIATGMAPEGQGVNFGGTLNYLTNRFNRGVEVARGDKWVEPMQTAPNYPTELLGSGLEMVSGHPLASMASVPTMFYSGIANDLLRNASPQTREAVDAGLGWVGPGNMIRMAATPLHMMASAHGVIPAIKSLLHAPAAMGRYLLPTGMGWFRTLSRAGIGLGAGSEEPPGQQQNQLIPP